jgi:hypothetical protein
VQTFPRFVWRDADDERYGARFEVCISETIHYSLPTVLSAEVEQFHMGDGFAKKLAAKTGEFFH